MRGTEWRLVMLAALALGSGSATTATAQLRVSEEFALVQIVDGDTVMITGSRPNQRGRDIYGSPQVPWGKSWTPGADMATALRVDRDFKINGMDIAAGSYSIWMVPREDDHWTLFLDKADLFHTAHPDTVGKQYVIPLVARSVDPVETLTWSINDMRGWTSRVELSWAGKAVDFELRLSTGDMRVKVAAAEATRMVGTYRISPEDRKEPFIVDRLVVTNDEGFLTFRFEGGNAPEWNDGTQWIMLPRGGDTFGWAMIHQGEVVGVMPWAVLEVAEGDDRARVIEVRTVPDDDLFVKAVRIP